MNVVEALDDLEGILEHGGSAASTWSEMLFAFHQLQKAVDLLATMTNFHPQGRLSDIVRDAEELLDTLKPSWRLEGRTE